MSDLQPIRHKKSVLFRFAVCLSVILFSSSLVACTKKSSQGSTNVGEERLAQLEELGLLADGFKTNFDFGNATFLAQIQGGESGATTPNYFQGQVDWTQNLVHMTPSNGQGAVPPAGSTIEAWLTQSSAALKDPEHPGQIGQRQTDIINYPTDAVSAYLLGLANAARQNTLLMAQDGTRFVETQTLGQSTYRVYQIGSLKVWLESQTNQVQRLEVLPKTAKGWAVIIQLQAFGKSPVPEIPTSTP